jgi:hypothetical protein
MNKETIKEAAITYWQTQVRRDTANPSNTAFCTMDFKAGVKWHEEQSVTDIVEFADWCSENTIMQHGQSSTRYDKTTNKYYTTKELYELWNQTKVN